MVKQERDPSTGAVSMKEVPGSEKLLDADVLIIAAGFFGKPQIYFRSIRC